VQVWLGEGGQRVKGGEFEVDFDEQVAERLLAAVAQELQVGVPSL
jgi:hypothetical protein